MNMIKNTFFTVLLLACILDSSAQTQSRNYIAFRTYTNASGTSWRDKFVYYDEMGREEQTILVGASPQGGSIISAQEYDEHGRISKTWLNGKATGTTGGYVSPFSTLEGYVKASNLNDAKPYTLVIYEASPLGRPIAEYGAGAEWQNNGKALTREYGVNVSGDSNLNSVHYSVTYSGTTATVSKIGNWPTGSQTVTKVTDEDGSVFYEFKDRNGEVVLQRHINAGIYLDTYYIRDGWGNILAVLPPAVSSQLTTTGGSWTSTSSDILKNYAYFYKYDSRYRQTGKKLPGCDWIITVYDASDTPIMIQDGVQRLGSQWTYIISDVWGRPCLSGTCTGSYSELSTVVKATRYSTSSSYSVSGLSFTPSDILVETYYDNYAFLGSGGFSTALSYTSGSGYGEKDSNSPIGMMTGIKKRLLDGSSNFSYLYNTVYYDYRGQIIQKKSTNLMSGMDEEYASYNFDGQPQGRKLVHSASGMSTITQEYEYTYDTWGRNTYIKHRLNNGVLTTIANNSYDDIGRLKYKNRNGVSALQSTYAYNVRSWTKSITGTLFSETLYYNDSRNTNTVKYNGSISAIDWKADSKQRGYDFLYDNLSRLTHAYYVENGSRSNKYNTQYSYDSMGNFLTLKRNGLQDGGTYGQIDDLTFTLNGNQVTKIEDAVNDPTYNGCFNFVDGSSASTEYEYDQNGNMTKDLNKNISSIQYNLLNLPQTITYSTNKSATYTYDAEGNKLRVVYTNPGSTTEYCGNMIYEGGTLKQILVDGGYVTLSGSTPTYHYYLQDHLGNNRVVCNASGTVEQVNHYYPFGGLFGESTNGDTQRYKYNSKEFDRMHGLDWYDYGARHMDAMRFTTMDPLAEKYYNISPYAYCGNNPVLLIDIDGRDWYKDGNGHLKWNSELSSYNAHELLAEGEQYLQYSDDGRVYATDASGRFYYGDKDGNINQFLMPEITINGFRNPVLHNSLAYTLMGFRGVTDSGIYGPWSPDAISIEGGINIQLGNLSYSYGLGLLSTGDESAIYSNVNSGFSNGFKLNFNGYLSFSFYNKNNPFITTTGGINIFEKASMNWGLGLGMIGVNYGYGTANGYDSKEYNSYGFVIGAGLGAFFGPSNSKYLIIF